MVNVRRVLPLLLGAAALCATSGGPACPTQAVRPTHTTLGFITTPNQTEWTNSYCWRLLTHVAWCHLEVGATGNLTPAWVPADWLLVPQLVAHVHSESPWTKVLLTVAISGHATEPAENKSAFLLNENRWPQFLAALAQRIHGADADGVIFDIEHIDKISGGLAAYSKLVLRTAAHLRGLPRPPGRSTLQTMLCTAQYTRVLPMPYVALAKGTDALFLMDYSDHGVSSQFAGPVTQLHSTAVKHPPAECQRNAPYGSLPGIDGMVAQWAALGVPPEKIILGLPWFGAEWAVVGNGSGAPVKGALALPSGGDARCGGHGCGLNALTTNQLADPATQVHWDACMQQPFYNRLKSGPSRTDSSLRNSNDDSSQTTRASNYSIPHGSGDGGSWVQGWFDNGTSLAFKYERAKLAGFQGVGVWGLWYGTLPAGAPLWAALANAFTREHNDIV